MSSKTKIDTKFLALDLELNQPSNRIIQVGVSIGSAHQSHEEYLTKKWYIDPGEPISEEIVKLTGITDEDIASHAVPVAQCAAELGALIVGHQTFVNPVVWGGNDSVELQEMFAAENVSFPYFGHRWIDVKTWTTFLALSHHPEPRSSSGGLRSHLDRYKVRFIGEAHRADVDAFNTLRLFFRLLERQRTMEGCAFVLANV